MHVTAYSLLLVSNKFCSGGGGGGSSAVMTLPHWRGSKWHSPFGSMPFHRAQKSLVSRAQPPHTCPRNGCCPHQKHYARGPYKSQVHTQLRYVLAALCYSYMLPIHFFAAPALSCSICKQTCVSLWASAETGAVFVCTLPKQVLPVAHDCCFYVFCCNKS